MAQRRDLHIVDAAGGLKDDLGANLFDITVPLEQGVVLRERLENDFACHLSLCAPQYLLRGGVHFQHMPVRAENQHAARHVAKHNVVGDG